eukprot:CAMPEP_0174342868 /NCGR_PEP_ID=MMETSP0810-20121108/26489_1 /TAXON_ID=73025 ORGANISM="Eutreptiella gymnastica-like, Strain CCMP1594" /NCGR_SAMPLE_ID=MMETSP0810 /ASSEMBLY_ACC=CAM_ASM_000659 /LENGTH=34 /DNA_ID= /DNA_START= /DNA_END= /DNA_ORIENTATION=
MPSNWGLMGTEQRPHAGNAATSKGHAVQTGRGDY